MAKAALICHPATIPPAVSGCNVGLTLADSGKLCVNYRVVGQISALRLPPPMGCERADGLWKTTCFEAFAMKADGSYVEFNFSPSGRWAAYEFSSYRENMANAPGPAPTLTMSQSEQALEFTATFDLGSYVAHWPDRFGLCAVIETRDGAKSFWSLAHPEGRPDFHHKDCFALSLPAPEPR